MLTTVGARRLASASNGALGVLAVTHLLGGSSSAGTVSLGAASASLALLGAVALVSAAFAAANSVQAALAVAAVSHPGVDPV